MSVVGSTHTFRLGFVRFSIVHPAASTGGVCLISSIPSESSGPGTGRLWRVRIREDSEAPHFNRVPMRLLPRPECLPSSAPCPLGKDRELRNYNHKHCLIDAALFLDVCRTPEMHGVHFSHGKHFGFFSRQCTRVATAALGACSWGFNGLLLPRRRNRSTSISTGADPPCFSVGMILARLTQ